MATQMAVISNSEIMSDDNRNLDTPVMDEDALICEESDMSNEVADAEVAEVNQGAASSNGAELGL